MTRYDQNIVLDLEFTPIKKANRVNELAYEIIQIGAVRVDPIGKIMDSFVSYVFPEYNTDVAPHIKSLTGIRTCDVCDADVLADVLDAFRDWVGDGVTRYVAWSGTDYAQLLKETNTKEIAFPEKTLRWMDLQRVCPRVMDVGNGRQMSLHKAIDWYGIKVDEENLHGALYDARVTAELLSNLLTGDYKEQKESLSSVMPDESESHASFTIGDKFASLLALKERLENE